MNEKQIPKTYEPAQVEDEIYQRWEQSGFFNPDQLPRSQERKPFVIVLPPPNATGTLHIGHAMYVVEDVMIRFERLRGKAALWLPGTDHAAIATNAKVERLLKEQEGLTRFDLGREKFIERVEDYIRHSQGTINHQLRKMGFSLDWSREAYTLDATRNRAVREIFKRMYDDGLIYRGVRVINWDPQAQSTISDDEVVHKEAEAILYTFRYSPDFPISIASTRPETKVGDTAVAVHPEDERYKNFIGKEFHVEFAGASLHIKVIADASVDPTFGTGALGVTPSHSAIDADLAYRHHLPFVQVINEQAEMTSQAGSLVHGKKTNEARQIIIDWLKKEGLLEKEETIIQNISTSERTGAVVEPLPKLQWFIDVNKPFPFRPAPQAPLAGIQAGELVTLKQLMQNVVSSGQITILPNRFEKVYFHWIDHLRDWNISRQIWFGHQIPVWYRGEEIYCGVEAPEGEGWQQDPDNLDTWFSSGLWTFSTLGWPEHTDDLTRFHPTDVLETGYDILFFWVARMILMTTYALGQIPFHHVYLHGLVRDDQGRKMSKSLGNIIDPIDVAQKYGTDAVRLSLIIGSTPGQDKKLSEEKIAGYRNFTNKLWNISRFILQSIPEEKSIGEIQPQTMADKWILSRLTDVVQSVTQHLETYQFSAAGEILRDFTWNAFADWYLEIAKIQRSAESQKESTDTILLFILRHLLIMWHPFMPFVTEEIWKNMPGASSLLMVDAWPANLSFQDKEAEKAFHLMSEIIVAIRNIRAEYKLPPSERLNARLVVREEKIETIIREEKMIIERMARLEELLIEQGEKEVILGTAYADCGPVGVYVAVLDKEKERERLSKEWEEVRQYLSVLEGKLANTEFITKAPEKVIDEMKQKYREAQNKYQALEEQLAEL